MANTNGKANTNGLRPRARSIPQQLAKIETDPSHHLTGGLGYQTPLGSATGEAFPLPKADLFSTASHGLWSDIKTARWVIAPASSFKLLCITVILWANWELLAPYVAKGIPNPFAPLLFISHPSPNSTPDDPRYVKGPLDFVFIAFYVIVWSFVRQSITLHLCRPIARHFGIRKSAKLDRFGEQGYAAVYFAFMGFWGVRIMSQLPTWWYNTTEFWKDYPHTDMKPELKRYYLMQASYWCQQLIVLVLKLEKPRKDYYELVAHHIVTLWLVGWSYGIHLTYIGNAVYVSMDIPDTFLAASKLLNYLQMERAKLVSFAVFMVIWSYFRHWLNWVILHSVWTQWDLINPSQRRFAPLDDVWMAWWMKYQVFIPILLLQGLNLFWYFFILRIAYRAITDFTATDDRSDDEDDGDDEPDNDKED